MSTSVVSLEVCHSPESKVLLWWWSLYKLKTGSVIACLGQLVLHWQSWKQLHPAPTLPFQFSLPWRLLLCALQPCTQALGVYYIARGEAAHQGEAGESNGEGQTKSSSAWVNPADSAHTSLLIS